MPDATARFGLPFILPGQAQKEVFHNEALTLVDLALHIAVEGPAAVDPPVAPLEGQAWVVGTSATGAWLGKDDSVAAWTEGGWRFLRPTPGLSAWQRSGGFWIHWTGAGWSGGELPAGSLVVSGKKVVGERQPAVPSPSGGTIIDEEARDSIAAVIATLKSHGLID